MDGSGRTGESIRQAYNYKNSENQKRILSNMHKKHQKEYWVCWLRGI